MTPNSTSDTQSESMPSSVTPKDAFIALNQEQTQNLTGFHALLQLMAQKLPETPLRTYNIVIVGLRGVGKSTLALMALAALGFRLLDVEKCVSEHSGMPEAKFLELVTVEQYQQLQYDLITAAVGEHKESKIIVMPLTVINSQKLLNYLRSDTFSFIINVECEEERILNYLNFEGDREAGIALIQNKFAMFRSISTHDFFNYFTQTSEWKRNLISIGRDEDVNSEASSYFVLKPVEREFIKFLTFLIRGPVAASASVGNLHLRSNFINGFSNCLEVPIPSCFESLEEKDFIGVDCIEFSIDMIELIKHELSTSKLKMSEVISKTRRMTNTSIPLIMSILNSLSEISLFIRELALSTSRDVQSIRSDLKNYYVSLLGYGIRLGIDYLSVDLALCQETPHNFFLDLKTPTESMFRLLENLKANCGSTEIVGSAHSFRSDFWESEAFSLVKIANSLNITTLRLSSDANLLNDNIRVASFLKAIRAEYHHIRVCAYNKGPLGFLSKAINQILTPIAMERVIEFENSLTLRQLLSILFSTHVLPSLRFFIIGQNVSKSLSPFLHGEAYKALGLPYTYQYIECKSFKGTFLQLKQQQNFGGAAVIMPFKLEALDHVDSMSNHVKVIGALNTIIAERDPVHPQRIVTIRGENTDWLGVRMTLQDNTSPINSVSPNKSALVIGSGGLSRSAIYALIQLGYENIMLYNRTKERAQKLADHYNMLSPMMPSKSLTAGELCDSKKDLKYFTIHVLLDEQFEQGILPLGVRSYPISIISCVPSSNPQTGELINIPVCEAWYSNSTGGVGLETGYDPLITPFLERTNQFSSGGWTALNGLNWLFAQSIAQFEMFTGKQAPVSVMKTVVSNIFEQRS